MAVINGKMTLYSGADPRRAMKRKPFNDAVAASLAYQHIFAPELNGICVEINEAVDAMNTTLDDTLESIATSKEAIDATALEVAAEAAHIDERVNFFDAEILAQLGVSAWVAGQTYDFPAVVICSDGGLYRAMQAGVISDPLVDCSGAWRWVSGVHPRIYCNAATGLRANVDYDLDSSAGSFTCALPAQGRPGDTIGLKDIGESWAINPIALTGLYRGDAEGLILDKTMRHKITLYFVDETTGWRLD